MRKTAGLLILAVMLIGVTAGVAYSAPKADLSDVTAALEENRYQDALDLLAPIIEKDKKNGEAFFLMGEAHAGLGQWVEAETAHQAAVDNKFKDARAVVGVANAMIALGQYAEVEAYLEKPLEKVKKPEEAAMLKNARGRAEFGMGNYSKAQEWFLGARYDDEDNLQYRVDLGNAYYEGQVFPLAASEYEAVFTSDPTRLDLMFRLGEIYYNQKRLTEARELFMDLLARDSTYNEAYFRLANIYMMAAQSRPFNEASGLYKAALALYKKVRVVNPATDPALVSKNIAIVYYYINAHDSAAVELQNAIDAGAKDPELRFYLGRSHMLLGHDEQAIESFDAYRDAMEQLSPPHEWVIGDAELFWRTATCMEALRDTAYLPRIAENYRQAVQLDPDDERSIGGLALAYHKLERYAEAAVEFEKLVVKHPSDARYLFNAALPYMQLGNDEKAVEYLLRAVESDTTESLTYRERGNKLAAPRLIKMQRTADAQKCYRWLMEREPDVCDHRKWYGFTLFAAKNYTAAAPILNKAYKCFEQLESDACKYNEMRWWLAIALYESGDKDASYKLCEKVVECSPSHKDARDLMNRIDEEIIEEN